MGTCYLCGKQHVNYRRTVQVGQSVHNSISSKGTSRTSIGGYYASRTVCAKCALNIDYTQQKRKINIFTGLSIVGFCIAFISPFIGNSPAPWHTTVKEIFSQELPIIIPTVIFLIVGVRKQKKHADIWYQENKDKYIDEIDIQILMQQKKLEEKRQNEQKQIEEYNNRLQTLNNQLQESGQIFNERLNQEISVITNKQDLMNSQLHSMNETEEELKNALKKLEDFQKEVEKEIKSINKICDDYIKQCKNLVFDKNLLPQILENIETNRAHKINYLNALIASINEIENKILKKIISFNK